MGKLESQIVSALQNSDKPLTLSEIAIKIGASEKKVYRSLRKLFQKEKIDVSNRRYKLAQE